MDADGVQTFRSCAASADGRRAGFRTCKMPPPLPNVCTVFSMSAAAAHARARYSLAQLAHVLGEEVVHVGVVRVPRAVPDEVVVGGCQAAQPAAGVSNRGAVLRAWVNSDAEHNATSFSCRCDGVGLVLTLVALVALVVLALRRACECNRVLCVICNVLDAGANARWPAIVPARKLQVEIRTRTGTAAHALTAKQNGRPFATPPSSHSLAVPAFRFSN